MDYFLLSLFLSQSKNSLYDRTGESREPQVSFPFGLFGPIRLINTSPHRFASQCDRFGASWLFVRNSGRLRSRFDVHVDCSPRAQRKPKWRGERLLSPMLCVLALNDHRRRRGSSWRSDSGLRPLAHGTWQQGPFIPGRHLRWCDAPCS